MGMGRIAMDSMRTAFRKFQKVGALNFCESESTNYFLCYDDCETAANIFYVKSDVINQSCAHANTSYLSAVAAAGSWIL